MKRSFLGIILILLWGSFVFSQYSASDGAHSFRYSASRGFVNIIELNGATGLVDHEGPTESQDDPESINSRYYFGVTNIVGFQIDRNFFAGVGAGFLHYEGDNFFPVFLEYKFNMYFKRFSSFFYADGGSLVHPVEFSDESKIFINPGIGLSRAISPKIEINLSAGYMVQARTTISRVTFMNFKLGVAFRKNSFRMFRDQ